MKLFIRKAELSDWLPVKDLLIRLHDSAPYSDVPVNESDMKRTFATTAKSKHAISLVVTDKKHNIHGIMIGVIQPNWWGAKCAIELVTYCEKPGWQDKLLSRYKQWAKEKKAAITTVVNSAGVNERYDKLISKKGFSKTGSVHMMTLEEL